MKNLKLIALLTCGVFAASCGSKPSGKYLCADAQGAWVLFENDSIKVNLMGNQMKAAYRADGKEIKIIKRNGAEKTIFTIDENGCLIGTDAQRLTFCKAK